MPVVARRGQQRPFAGRGAVRLLAGAVPAGVLAVVLFPEVVGLSEWLPFAPLAAIRPFLALLVLAGSLISMRWCRTTDSRLCVVLVAAIGVAGLVPAVSRAVEGSDRSARADDLSVLSLNVDMGHADVAALSSMIRRLRPDLVVLPEAGESYLRRLEAGLVADGYRGWASVPATVPDAEGVVMLAGRRLGPVTAAAVLGTTFSWLELAGGNLGALRLVGVHAAPPIPGLTEHWAADLSTVRRWCSEPGPAVVAGDFNATLDNAPLRWATQGCDDAATRDGAGLGATWPSQLPGWLGVQIDHVLSRGASATSFRRLDLPGSDHRAVMGTLAVSTGLRSGSPT